MRKFFERHTPPGWPVNKELLSGGVVLVVALLFACTMFGTRYSDSLRNIYYYNAATQTRTLIEGSTMTPFAREVSGIFTMFWMYVFVEFAEIWNMYRSFSVGSKSIYVMRRLPDRGELARRCLPMPLIMLAAGLAVCMLFLLAFWLIYKANVPEAALPPDTPVRFFDLFVYNIFA